MIQGDRLNEIRARVAAAPNATATQVEIDRDGTTRWINVGPFPCASHEDAAKVRDVASFIHSAPADLRALLDEVERLQGIVPDASPPEPEVNDAERAPQLPRYGIRWNGPKTPITVPMEDGYWTPWHIAAGQVRRLWVRGDDMQRDIERLRGIIFEARESVERDFDWGEHPEPADRRRLVLLLKRIDAALEGIQP